MEQIINLTQKFKMDETIISSMVDKQTVGGDSLVAFRNQARKGTQSTIRSREDLKPDLAKYNASKNNFLGTTGTVEDTNSGDYGPATKNPISKQ